MTTTTEPALKTQNSPGPHSESTITRSAEAKASGANARAAATALAQGVSSIRPQAIRGVGSAVAVGVGEGVTGTVGLEVGGCGESPHPLARTTITNAAIAALSVRRVLRSPRPEP